MSKAWGKGSTRAWRRTRALVLARDGYTCQVRTPGVCTGRAQHVHHTQGKAAGDDMRHLVASCAACNLKLGDPTKTADPPGRSATRW